MRQLALLAACLGLGAGVLALATNIPQADSVTFFSGPDSSVISDAGEICDMGRICVHFPPASAFNILVFDLDWRR